MKAAPSLSVSCILADTEVKHPLKLKLQNHPLRTWKAQSYFSYFFLYWTLRHNVHIRINQAYGDSKMEKEFKFLLIHHNALSPTLLKYFAPLVNDAIWTYAERMWRWFWHVILVGRQKTELYGGPSLLAWFYHFFYLFVVENWLHHFYRTQVNLWSDLWDVMQT